jgi:sterol 3beta-glucosyltransferase
MPFIADQPWWAKLLHTRGYGPKPLSRKTTNPKRIAARLLQALDYSEATNTAGEAIRIEDGLGRALALMEQAESGVLTLRSN